MRICDLRLGNRDDRPLARAYGFDNLFDANRVGNRDTLRDRRTARGTETSVRVECGGERRTRLRLNAIESRHSAYLTGGDELGETDVTAKQIACPADRDDDSGRDLKAESLPNL